MDTRRNDKAPARKWYIPPRTLNKLMSAVALSGLAFGSLAQGPGFRPRPVPPLTYSPYPWGNPRPTRPPAPQDRFVVVPREDLDPGFVAAAPEGIDDGMIASPGGRFAAPTPPQMWTIPVPRPAR